MKEKDSATLKSLIDVLIRNEKPVWKKIAYELSRPSRVRTEVNLSKLDSYGKESATIIVPGKVLGSGLLSKKLTVAAFSFSQTAQEQIHAAGGKAMSISALYQANPEGKNVIILK
jgi:large subunit ribosomal protein L18e